MHVYIWMWVWHCVSMCEFVCVSVCCVCTCLCVYVCVYVCVCAKEFEVTQKSQLQALFLKLRCLWKFDIFQKLVKNNCIWQSEAHRDNDLSLAAPKDEWPVALWKMKKENKVGIISWFSIFENGNKAAGPMAKM